MPLPFPAINQEEPPTKIASPDSEKDLEISPQEKREAQEDRQYESNGDVALELKVKPLITLSSVDGLEGSVLSEEADGLHESPRIDRESIKRSSESIGNIAVEDNVEPEQLTIEAPTAPEPTASRPKVLSFKPKKEPIVFKISAADIEPRKKQTTPYVARASRRMGSTGGSERDESPS